MTNYKVNTNNLTKREVERLNELQKLSLVKDCGANITTDIFGNTVIEFQDMVKFLSIFQENGALLEKLQPVIFEDEEIAIEGSLKKGDAVSNVSKTQIKKAPFIINYGTMT